MLPENTEISSHKHGYVLMVSGVGVLWPADGLLETGMTLPG